MQKTKKKRGGIAPPSPCNILPHRAIPPHGSCKPKNYPSRGLKGLQQQKGVKQEGRPVAMVVQKRAVPHQSFVMPFQSALGLGVKSVTSFRYKVSVYKKLRQKV